MDRRVALISLGGAMMSLLPAAPSHSDAAQVSDKTFSYQACRRNTLANSTISREASEITMRRATNMKVKMFAGLERAEQLTLEQVMDGLRDPPLASVGSEHRAALAKLNDIPPGRDFDSAYVNAEIKGHEALLAIQEDLLQAHPDPTTDRAHIAFFMTTFINEHLALLADIKIALG
jgi:putative membrane protein